MSIISKVILVIALWAIYGISFVPAASATTRNVTCSGDITSAINTTIGASADGDTVSIGAGSCSTSPWNINDKNITIIGAGKGVTNLTANSGLGQWVSNTCGPVTFRLSGFTVSSSSGQGSLTVWANLCKSYRGPFRIDHVNFNFPNGGNNLSIFGPIWGLVDHNDFHGSFENAIIVGLSLDASLGENASTPTTAKGSWAAGAIPFAPGSPQMTYVEDNTCTGVGNGIALIDTDYSGSRMVFRHNTMMNCAFYSHWTSAGNINSQYWEIYNNNMDWVIQSGGIPVGRNEGGGTGLVYNNTFGPNFVAQGGDVWAIGEQRLENNNSAAPLYWCANVGLGSPANGPQAWDNNLGDPAAPGWPCLSQVGRGAGVPIASIIAKTAKQPSFPMYFWNNGPEPGCSTGGVCSNSFRVGVEGGPAAYFKSTPHPNGDVDYSITASKPAGAGTHTLSYTPFVYPYPLKATGMPDPSGSPPPPPPPPPPPLAAPNVKITSPASGTTFTGPIKADIAVSAADTKGIKSITIQRDGKILKTCINATSCSDTFRGPSLPGTHTITASAINGAGIKGTASIVITEVGSHR